MQEIATTDVGMLQEVMGLLEHAPIDQWMRLVTRAEVREAVLAALRTVVASSIPSLPEQLTLEIE